MKIDKFRGKKKIKIENLLEWAASLNCLLFFLILRKIIKRTIDKIKSTTTAPTIIPIRAPEESVELDLLLLLLFVVGLVTRANAVKWGVLAMINLVIGSSTKLPGIHSHWFWELTKAKHISERGVFFFFKKK